MPNEESMLESLAARQCEYPGLPQTRWSCGWYDVAAWLCLTVQLLCMVSVRGLLFRVELNRLPVRISIGIFVVPVQVHKDICPMVHRKNYDKR